MKLSTQEDMVKRYPLLFALFSANYVLGQPDGEAADHSVFRAMFQSGEIPGPMDSAERELAGLTGAQLALVLQADPGEDLPFAPLAHAALTEMFE